MTRFDLPLRTWRGFELAEDGERRFLGVFAARPMYATARAMVLWPEVFRRGAFVMERDPDELALEQRDGARCIAEVARA
jgi:hypothetical protein